MQVKDRAIIVYSDDGQQLSLSEFGPPGGVPVVLTHGTFSNRRSCAGLANFLAENGYHGWVFEWRGHGNSHCHAPHHNFDDVAERDVPAVLAAVMERTGYSKVFWVGHSGGALLAAMWMARNPALAREKLQGLVMLGAQATGGERQWRRWIKIGLIRAFLHGRTFAPGQRFGIGPESESAELMRQWCMWNLSGRFTARDGFDYLAALKAVDVPVLALAGAGDYFIAPESGCRTLFQAFGGANNQFVLCSRARGFQQNYLHHGLVTSRTARIDIWPLITHWMACPAEAELAPTASRALL